MGQPRPFRSNFTSVRELESRLQQSKGWERKPKPVVKEPEPQDPASPTRYMAKVANMYSLVRLAFETDSTRSVTLMLDSVSARRGDQGHNHQRRLSQPLASREIGSKAGATPDHGFVAMRLLADLFKGLKAVSEGGETVLDRAMVLYGSNLGDANAHSTANACASGGRRLPARRPSRV